MRKITISEIGKTIISACILMTFGCNNASNKDSKEVASEMNEEKFDREGEKAADKLVDAYSSNLYEIRLSENAVTKAVTADVKKLAETLVAAHTKMNADIQNLASSRNVTLPTDLTDAQRKDVEKYNDKHGVEYDKDYTKEMKGKHEDAIKKYERTAEKCDDADVKSWASQTLPEVRSHLDMVESTWNSIKDMKDKK